MLSVPGNAQERSLEETANVQAHRPELSRDTLGAWALIMEQGAVFEVRGSLVLEPGDHAEIRPVVDGFPSR